MNLLGDFSEYYYVVLLLQAICVFHTIRRGTQSKWIWIIVFLPFIGSLIYIFTEIINQRDISSAKSGFLSALNPTGRITKLEHQYNFSGTFANRIALADAYLQSGFYDKAIALYEPVLTGSMFDNSDEAIKNLMLAYYKTERYEDVVRMAPKVINSLNFTKTPANLYYALSLEKLGRIIDADTEFKKLNQRFCNYQQRYNYGCFLTRQNRNAEALDVLKAVVAEAEFLSSREKNDAREWINLAKQEYKKLAATNPALV